jgi:hypothetical protein
MDHFYEIFEPKQVSALPRMQDAPGFIFWHAKLFPCFVLEKDELLQ